ncbi:MAG: excisionase [Bacteroides sp.]|nr:DNA-binding protein [Eubacterium sp.]MCM1463359.1 excisionase [Bacteroides sp.]
MEEKSVTSIPLGEKYLLTVKEAGSYFNIGVKKMRRLAEDNLGVFSVYSGNKYLVIRPKFEEYICQTSTI